MHWSVLGPTPIAEMAFAPEKIQHYQNTSLLELPELKIQ